MAVPFWCSDDDVSAPSQAGVDGVAFQCQAVSPDEVCVAGLET